MSYQTGTDSQTVPHRPNRCLNLSGCARRTSNVWGDVHVNLETDAASRYRVARLVKHRRRCRWVILDVPLVVPFR